MKIKGPQTHTPHGENTSFFFHPKSTWFSFRSRALRAVRAGGDGGGGRGGCVGEGWRGTSPEVKRGGGEVWEGGCGMEAGGGRGKSQSPLAGLRHHPAYHSPPLSRVTIIPQSTLWTVAPSSTPQPTPWTAARPCHNSPHRLRHNPACHTPAPGAWHHHATIHSQDCGTIQHANPPPGPWMIEIFSRLFSIASYMAMGCCLRSR